MEIFFAVVFLAFSLLVLWTAYNLEKLQAVRKRLVAIKATGQHGLAGMQLLTGLIGIVVVLIVLGTAIPVLWPMAADTSDNIAAMSGTDSGTSMIKAFWPIALLVIGLGIAIGVIVLGLKKFGLLGGGKGGL